MLRAEFSLSGEPALAFSSLRGNRTV